MTRATAKDAYPLRWPEGWPRTPPGKTRRSQFRINPDEARRRLLYELRRLKVTEPILSTNVPLRRDGQPYAVGRGDVADPGVAVYFLRAGQQAVIACDHYDEVGDNIRAIGLTIEALRAMARHGATSIMDRAFRGFLALPAATAPPPPWWHVLGVEAHTATADVDAAYRKLRRASHPDAGGSAERFNEVNEAWERFRQERGLGG